MKWVMVLNDGTTYSDLDGCAIVAVPDHVEDNDVDEYVREADGYYCFNHQVDFESNNGFEADELAFMDSIKHYEKCSGCGEMFNLSSGFERIMWTKHVCHEKIDINEQETE